jgi:hypothetical protein
MYRRTAEAEGENNILRKAAGHLVVSDEKLVYGRKLETNDPFLWKWRLFLPKGRRFVLKATTSEIPPKRLPDTVACICPIGTWAGSEVLLAADIDHSPNGTWFVILKVEKQKLDLAKGLCCDDPGSIRVWGGIPISSPTIELLKGGGLECDFFGDLDTEAADPGEPITIMRVRPINESAPRKAPEPGVMIWLEELKQPTTTE